MDIRKDKKFNQDIFKEKFLDGAREITKEQAVSMNQFDKVHHFIDFGKVESKRKLRVFMRNIFLKIFKFLDHPHISEKNPINYNNTNDYLFLCDIHSAKKHIYLETTTLVIFSVSLGLVCVQCLSWLAGVSFFVIVSGAIALFYFLFMVFKVWVMFQAIKSSSTLDFSKKEIEAISDYELPIYTILIPLYQEAKVIPQIIKAMTAIDYPTDKLDIIITLEEYDHETINAIKKAAPPSYFKTLILPNVKPKTKPKALNVAFLKTKGEFLVIYDAEIVPEPDQLKKAYLAFRKNSEIGSLQTRLDHYNPEQSLITRLFNSEFSFHYDFFLPGLQKIGCPLPLSGHSTHFRKNVLEKIGAWDPYNVTEDCDLGIRLHRIGYRAGMLNSVSLEEATGNFKNWTLQRTRWMKGFIQTSIVHLRHPLRFKNEIGGWKSFVGFLFVVPASVIVNVINFAYWIILLLWIILHPVFIQELFPGPILYLSFTSFIVGNFIFTYLNLLASYKRGRFALVKYNLFSFVYWIMLAIATTRAAFQMITKPHYWEKTKHGDHIKDGKHFIFQGK